MISWLFKAAKTGEVKTLAQAIRVFFKKNNRMPSTIERNTMGSILQDITKKSNVIDFPKDKITPFYKPRPTPEEINKQLTKALEERKAMFPGSKDKTLFKDSPEAIAKIKAENKAAVERLRDKKIKSKEPVGLFANEQEFAEDLYSSTQNFIKNDPQFNLELAKTFQKPGVKTYGWTPTGDKSKLLSPQQRQKKLDKLKEIMHHEEYQHQFGESLFDEDGVSILIDDLFRIEKASGGIARVGMFGGGAIVKGGNWFLKALRDTRKLMIQNKQHSPEQLKHYLNQIDDQIKNIEAGGKIPDEVIQTIRSDPKFKSVSQTQVNDPDLREIEEVLLEYGEKHASGGIAGQLHLNEGGRAGFPFGGQALKAIRQAWRSNKDWGVGGPPYNPGATTFDIKELTKRMFGKELSLSELRQLEKSPLMGKGGETFDQFNQKFKNIKASVLREKMMERKLQAKAMINAANKTMKDATKEFESAFGPLRDTKKQEMAKKITSQMTRESKKSLAEVREGLKEIDIYMGMLQKKGRRVHASGGLAHVLGV